MFVYLSKRVTWKMMAKILALWIALPAVMMTYFENASLLRKIFLLSGGVERYSVRTTLLVVVFLLFDFLFYDILRHEIGKKFDTLRSWMYLVLSFTWLANLLATQKFQIGGWPLIIYFGGCAIVFIMMAFLDRTKRNHG